MLKSAFLYFFLSISVAGSLYAQNLNTDSLLLLLHKSPEDTGKVNLYRNIGVSLAHQDPNKAIAYWKRGVELSKKLNYDMGLARSYINISTGYSFMGKFDSCVIYNDTAIIYCHKIKDINRLALVYLNQGDAYRNSQDFKKALLYCDTALNYAEQTGNTDRLARIYDIISDIYASQKHFSSSISYLNKALPLYIKDENLQMVGQVYSDFADIHKQMNKHDSAIIFYKKAIHIADSVQDLKNLSTYYADLTDLYIHQGRYNEAEISAAKSLEYALGQESSLQLATIYNHLSNLYLKQKKFIRAVEAGNQAYKYSVEEDNLLWQKESATVLAEAYYEVKDFTKAYQYLSISKTLNDSILKQQFSSETARLQTSFEIKGKDKEIQLLNKDKELQRQKFSRQKTLMAGSIALVILLLVGIGLLVSRHRLRQRMKELELRNQIAADLHDEVGSSLSSIHMLSQIATQKQDADATQKDILTRMSTNAKETMDKMGDIVWMIKPGESEASSLKHRMERFAFEICSSRNIDISIYLDELEKVKLTMNQRKNLYLIFKEALNNAVKYSGTKKIEIKINTPNKQLILLVKDYGGGFDLATTGLGNGVDNMKNRATELNGRLEIDSQTGKGTTIQLIIPV